MGNYQQRLDALRDDKQAGAYQLMKATADIEELQADLEELEELSSTFDVQITNPNGTPIMFVEAYVGLGQFVSETLPNAYQWAGYGIHFQKEGQEVFLKAKIQLDHEMR